MQVSYTSQLQFPSNIHSKYEKHSTATDIYTVAHIVNIEPIKPKNSPCVS